MSVVRVLFGYILACLAAGATKVAFVFTPAELASLPADVASDRLGNAAWWALAAATQSAIFAAPLALVGAIVGEWRRYRDWTYYALLGIAIAVVGFFARHMSEAAGQPTIVNNYALTAFLTAGFVGGVVYWLLAGRGAGGPVAAYVHGRGSSGRGGQPAKVATAGGGNGKPSAGSGTPKKA